MKRRAPALLALLVSVGVIALARQEGKYEQQRQEDAAAQRQEAFTAAANAEKSEDPPATGEDEEPLAIAVPSVPASGAPVGSSSSFHLLPDGSPVPPLATDAPKRVKLAVALFRYKGVQDSIDSGRTKEQALALAQKATEMGKEDFAAAVKEGDRGSSSNIGWIRQRILERSVEYAVFSLKKGEITTEPIDTPRGFWVAKRLR